MLPRLASSQYVVKDDLKLLVLLLQASDAGITDVD